MAEQWVTLPSLTVKFQLGAKTYEIIYPQFVEEDLQKWRPALVQILREWILTGPPDGAALTVHVDTLDAKRMALNAALAACDVSVAPS